MFIVFPSCYETLDLIDGGEKQRNLQLIGKPLDYSRTLFCCVNAVIHQSYEDDSLVVYIALILVFVVVCSPLGYPRFFVSLQNLLLFMKEGKTLL